MINKNNLNFIFFGTDEFAVFVLLELKEKGLIPKLIVTNPDRHQGRHLTLTPSPVKSWALKEKIEFIQPENLTPEEIKGKYPQLIQPETELFLVASYGKILPLYLINLPTKGTLNIHPSLLPKYRGPSPITTPILAGDKISGVTIMQVDEKMDHGPILIQKEINIENKNYAILESEFAKMGVELLATILSAWLENNLIPKTQDHQQASFTKKITKIDGLINMADKPLVNYRKFLALNSKSGVYFFLKNKGREIRIKITAAHMTDSKFIIDKVIPAGKQEMLWSDFCRNI